MDYDMLINEYGLVAILTGLRDASKANAIRVAETHPEFTDSVAYWDTAAKAIAKAVAKIDALNMK